MQTVVCLVTRRNIDFMVLKIRNGLTLCDRDVLGFLNEEKVVELLNRSRSCLGNGSCRFHSSV